MELSPAIFREYDIRGVADRDLTSPVVHAIGRAFGERMQEGASAARVAVARDCRLSSPRLHEALVAGLLAAGCRVIDVGVGPTPLLYFAAHHLVTDGAIMITGSHNPPDENGLKMMRGLAPFFGADIVALRQRAATVDDAPASSATALNAHSVEVLSLEDAYMEALTSRTRLRKAPFRVVLDAGNGAGGPLALRALRACGVDVDPLYCEMDGTFPHHHPDPTDPATLTDLIARVRQTGARVGLALDGDADRLGVVDDEGTIFWGDRLLLLFARSILRDHPGAAIVGEVKCSQTTYDDIAAHGGRPILWKTGHSLIKTKMKAAGALLAGEMSGHLFFADRWFGFDDALYACLRLVELLVEEGKTLRELTADVPVTSVTPELRVPCPDEVKFDVVAAVLDRYRETHEVIDVDGVRILFGAGAWGLVRASNTQPALVLRFEAESDVRRDELRAAVEAVVHEEHQRVLAAR